MAVSKCPYNRGTIVNLTFSKSVLIIEGLLDKKTVYPLFQFFFQIIRQILNSHKKYDNNKKTCYNTMYSDN